MMMMKAEEQGNHGSTDSKYTRGTILVTFRGRSHTTLSLNVSKTLCFNYMFRHDLKKSATICISLKKSQKQSYLYKCNYTPKGVQEYKSIFNVLFKNIIPLSQTRPYASYDLSRLTKTDGPVGGRGTNSSLPFSFSYPSY